ncbi:polyribonucleotide nucleotidyltransferase [Candidatus Paracaedibacter symbiosus]|uniref:polyribonucleotide nucleotidyltransferase n=1 Tax=Candidatus Paracaedibacter symbiosus TaxID=244582 RepID=UPI000A04C7D2|nr:polyribonucleotide nucleotidyltransferase [Candidatus Paracaedibacter symbiosus]
MSEFFKIARQEMEWAGRKLILETGRVARQADGAVLATYGNSTVLCTVVGAKTVKPDIDFFPLSVHYQEKTFAVGRIPGGFGRREGKPSDTEVLASRLIDRPIRPLFPEGFFHEVQVICTVLSYDQENDCQVLAMIGASAALALSGLPFQGPVAGANVGYIDGEFVLNPTQEQSTISKLALVVAGTSEGVLMVESEAHELSEELMLEAVVFGHKAFQPILKMIDKLKKEAGKDVWDVAAESKEAIDMFKKVKKAADKELRKSYSIPTKKERLADILAVKMKTKEKLAIETDHEKLFSRAFKQLEAEIMRGDILKKRTRVDGRDLTTVRNIDCQVGILARTHGSALFTRGETQALVVTTLGTSQDEQIIDGIEGEYRERFLLHYNFPPFSVNETGRVGAPGRREIGHGKLAWRAIRPLLPAKDKFPYTIRTVSEITESNGSSSMATVCGTSLSMMDAGVPLPRPVAGIAMGLIKEGKDFAVLTDILGDEDHLGDMDFKVAGTEAGVTALQMDIKITSITPEIMQIALGQAKEGRLHILDQMAKVITAGRTAVSDNAPKMVTVSINRDKIRDLIGPGGKTIREICEVSGTRIDIEEEGTVNIAGYDNKSIEIAKSMIRNIACDPEVGQIYLGKVVKIMDFGAFVNFMGSRDGLVHISELAAERVNRVSDIVKVGEEVKVKVLGFDDRGKVKLSMKAVANDAVVAAAGDAPEANGDESAAAEEA